MYVSICICSRDYGKTKSEKAPKTDAAPKPKKPKEKKEGGEEDWKTVVKKGSGHMTKQVHIHVCTYMYMHMYICVRTFISTVGPTYSEHAYCEFCSITNS